MSVASVAALFAGVGARRAAQPFLRAPAAATAGYADGALEFSYAQAAAQVDALRRGYAARLPASFCRVAIAFDSRLDVYLHFLALNGLAVGVVPLNMTAGDDEIRYLVEHSDSVLVVGAGEHLERLGGILDGGPPVIGADGLDPDAPAAGRDGTAETEAALLYTSGTTGKPKGCMLSNAYFLRLGHWYASLGGLCGLRAGDRVLTPLPPNHMNALATSFMGVLTAGATLIQLDRFHPSSWWQTVRDEGTTVVHYLGVMPAILLKLPPRADDSFAGQVRFGFGAGADPKHQAVFEGRFGFPLIEAWAMTETGAAALTIADREPRHVGKRCIGRPVASMEYRLVDEQDNHVAAGEPGELLVRTRGDEPRDGFFSGYYKDPEATDEAWRGGWFHTGDVVRADAAGSLFFVDRRKNVIRRSGENIAAVEVEAALLALDSVANVAVCAVPDELRGDEVFALVVPAAGADRDEAAARRIADQCRDRLSYFKVPGYVAFADELPLTPSQKVRRGDVKTQARAAVDAGDCFDLRALKRRRADA